ncbi:class I SAM-dependent methyltransferase [Paenibacillus doosanensis]|uniref:class I SAM-dependent methyltransferase n=1 Tax=Paenibacillus doosanensis TaxID=1229154 RepID=UPI00217F410C|nr:class I SAM-dependent methyltransferase [Paenibacillus doosanensis]
MNNPFEHLKPSEFWMLAWEQAFFTDRRTGDDTAEERFWLDNAASFDERHPLAPYTEPLMNAVFEHLSPGDHLLEIGAGTGGFTRLMAPHVGSISIVEPSAAMYAVFKNNWARLPYPLPHVYPEKWEELQGASADIVFAANAMYRIRDMKDSLLRMNRTASRRVFLVQSVGRPFAGPLAVTLEGRTEERTRASVLSDILTELGLEHRCELFPVQRKNGMVHDVALIHWQPGRS